MIDLLNISAKEFLQIPRVELPGEEDINCISCRRCYGSRNCCDCMDCKYCTNCIECTENYQCHDCFRCLECCGCKNCIGIINGHNLQFVVYGQQLTEEQYNSLITKLRDSNYID